MNCSNGRIHKQETKDKISKKLFKGGRKMKDKVLKVKKPLFNNCCIFCQKKYQTKKELQKYCSRDCVNRSGINRENGKISASYQNKRSKNEILFSEYCASKFNILTNIPMFNGVSVKKECYSKNTIPIDSAYTYLKSEDILIRS